MAIPGSLAALQPAGDDEIPRKIRDLERSLQELGPSVARSFAPVIADLQAKQVALDAQQVALAAANATLATQQATLTAQGATLTTTVTNLATAQGTLATTVSGLSAAQSTLTAQQASLTSQLASINALIGQQVAGDARSTDTGPSGVSLTASNTNYATVTFTVPAGFTRAIVTGSSNMYYAGTASGVVLYVSINGTAGYKQTSAASFTAISNTTSTVLTGLTGGATFTVSSLAAYSGTGSMSAYIATTAWVTYLR